MAVLRSFNFLGGMRIDVPHLRLIESAVAGDFDVLAGYMVAGKQPLIVKGFALDVTGVQGPSTNLRVLVADSSLLHYGASESGTIFRVPAGQAPEPLSTTNPNVIGAFVSGTTNYVGIDLVRAVDPSTTDLVAFLPANSSVETTSRVPLARTLQYRFVISTSVFSSSSNVCPLAIVSVDGNGFATQIQDARTLLFRLGSGGDVPNSQNVYGFTARADSPNISTSSAVNCFGGGDKDIGSLKQWQDAMMTRLWELGGGEYWYSQSAERNVTLMRGTTGSAGPFPSSGDYFMIDASGNVLWRGLALVFASSTATYNTVVDQTTPDNVNNTTKLAVGQCFYVDVDRGNDGVAITGVRGTLATLGQGLARPGSRYVLVWRTAAGYFARGSSTSVGTPSVPVATVSSQGTVSMSIPPATASNPIAIGVNEKNAASGVAALDSASRVLATGISRNAAGTLTIGDQPNDSAVSIGKTSATTTVQGNLTVAQTLSPTGGINTPAAATVGALTAGPATLGATSTGALTTTGTANVSGALTAGSVASAGNGSFGSLTVNGSPYVPPAAAQWTVGWGPAATNGMQLTTTPQNVTGFFSGMITNQGTPAIGNNGSTISLPPGLYLITSNFTFFTDVSAAVYVNFYYSGNGTTANGATSNYTTRVNCNGGTSYPAQGSGGWTGLLDLRPVGASPGGGYLTPTCATNTGTCTLSISSFNVTAQKIA